MTQSKVIVVGAGLAGSEAAWQARTLGVPVDLYEMRPQVLTPAHKSDKFAELVCSNSLGALALANASGLLKEEMRRLGSLIMGIARVHSVPAGGALAVDRWGFAASVTARLESDPLVRVIRQEVTGIPLCGEGPAVIATGPLTSASLAASIVEFTGREGLYFYDAASPIVARDSIDMEQAFLASRYGKGQTSDYINCPLTEEQYKSFYEALTGAESATKHDFEESHFFEGCLPVEEIARRGFDTLRYGPMKPVGLRDPRTGKRPYAVVQLRQDDKDGRMFNIVGFQTSLKWGEQDRVFRLIPALARAEFLRHGVMHRNTYLEAPLVLLPTMQTRKMPALLFAGQIAGVEGYVESCAMGLIAGINAARLALGREPITLPETTMIGALAGYVCSERNQFLQPINANWGLLPKVAIERRGRKYRNEAMADRALSAIRSIL